MIFRSRDILFWALVIGLGVFTLALNIQFSGIVDGLYKEGRLDVLNRLSGGEGDLPPDYYLGKIEDACLGPVTNLIAHILFAAFGLLYLRPASSRLFGFFVFIFLVLTKFNVLFYPPYGDAVGGPFAEALWLAKNNFDFIGLYHQPGYQFGGPKVYLFSLYPTYLAVLFKAIPHTPLFLIVNHLLVYVMAAVVVTLTRSLAQKAVDSAAAILGAVFVLALPLFQSQTEAINMEMPCLFFSMLAIYALAQRKMGRAGLWAVAAVLVKGHGLIICGAVVGVSLWLFLLEPESRRNGRMMIAAASSGLAAFLIVFSKFLMKDQHAGAGMIQPLAGWPSLKGMYLPYLYLAGVTFFALAVLKENRWQMRAAFTALRTRYFLQTVVFLAAGLWFGLFLNFFAVSPRYKLELAPFLVLSLVFALMKIPFTQRQASVLLMTAVGIAAFSSYGLLEKPLKANYHVLLERSLEYRNDLKLNKRLVQRLEERYKNYTIAAPFIMAQMLAMPELGYVKAPLDVVVYGMPVTYGNIRNFDGLNTMNLMKTIWVGMAADFFASGDFTYPVSRHDKVIEHLVLGDNRAVLFMGGVAVEQKRYIIQELRKKALNHEPQ